MPSYELDVTWDGDHVEGVLRGADGGSRRFEGWLELLRLLEPEVPAAPAGGTRTER